MTQETTTVIAVFEDYSTAESVARDLANAGFERENIQVQSNFRTGAAGRTDSGDTQDEGGISGFFHRLFGGHEDAGHYSEAVRRGNAVVSLTAPADQIDRAVGLMNERGAIDIDREVENYRERGYERHDPTDAPYSHEEALRERDLRAGDRVIPVVEEELHVGKRQVRSGGVRVYSHVVEKPVNTNVELREEHVRVERRPVDRPLRRGELPEMRDQRVEVEEMAEQVVVEKRARVREEVVIGKESTSRTEKVTGNVRSTEVKVEPLERTNGSGSDYTDDFRRHYETRYARFGESFDTFRPAYEYGYTTAGQPDFRGRTWGDAENDLRTGYLRRYPNSAWDRMKEAVRHGWEKVTR